MAESGEEIKKLGFGLMRLPQKDGHIDIEQTKEMVDLFMEAGFTYFDTAWAYDGSEEAAREALVERYPRDSFKLATKTAPWTGSKTKEEAWAQFDESLARTGAGYFDYYLLHNVGEERTQIYDRFDMWEFIREKKEAGLIRNMGFSFHSTPEELDELLEKHPDVDFVQLQINYADWENPGIQSRACYEVARKHGKPIVVMEPVKGGMLAEPPEKVKELLRSAEPEASCASWAIRFSASLPGVITVLSGMSDVAQMKDNISYMKDFTGLTKKEQGVIEKAQKLISEVPLIPCTDCNYCAKVCPNNIGISGIFKAVNQGRLYGKKYAISSMQFTIQTSGKAGPDKCVQCGQCEKVCPQHIAIRDGLKEAAEILH